MIIRKRVHSESGGSNVGFGSATDMQQDDHDMTLDPNIAGTPSSRTTAAGLESWLSGKSDQASLGSDEVAIVEDPAPAALVDAGDIGPVNAAEALALGTISAARKLVGADGAELVVDPLQDAYYFESTSLKPLAILLQQPASAWIPVYSEAMKAIRACHAAQPLPRLRWYAGLIATPGILGRELHRAGRYRLSYWPETEREFPKHFRIAKEMLEDAVTVDEVVTSSGMPNEEVVDYINASYAGGRLDASSVKKSSRKATALSRRERLIARLNKPLFAR
ncbi:MAG: hypothetical protein ACREPZ_07345 [Rhodanobacteraceae bacterium]